MEIDINFAEMERQLMELDTALSQVPPVLAISVGGDMARAMGRVGRDAVRDRAPVKTGALARSVRVTSGSVRYKGQKIPRATAQIRVGGRGARHAALITFGTFKQPPNTYFEDALRAATSRMLSEAVQEGSTAFTRTMMQVASGNPPARIRRLAE